MKVTALPDKVRILFIDDDEDDFIVISDLFKDATAFKAELNWISSYQRGRSALSKDDYDVAMIDYRLGEGTGLDLIKEALIQNVSRPMILMTGYGHQEVDLEAMRVGASDYLVKDQITAPLLERTIRYSVNRAANLKALRQEKENFRDIFNSTFEGIFIHSDGVILDLNETAAKIFGFDRPELLGRDARTLFEHQSQNFPVSTNETLTRELVGFKKDGSKLELEVSGKSYNYSGKPARLVTVRDITARKQLEAQVLVQDRLASLGLMASSLAHEIGTPLGVMRGRAELLANLCNGQDAAKKNVDIIISQIDRVSTLIRSLLTLARGGDNQKIAVVRLQDVLKPILEFLAHEFRSKEIDLVNEVEQSGSLAVRAEANSLQQVILNLLVNAVHAIEQKKQKYPEEKYEVRIGAVERSSTVQLSISDNGSGISGKNLANIFKPFFTTKEIGKGTGLGLATSYRILESWGGSIQVASKEGDGTTFTLMLPTGR